MCTRVLVMLPHRCWSTVVYNQSRSNRRWHFHHAACPSNAAPRCCDLCNHHMVCRGSIPRRIWHSSTMVLPCEGWCLEITEDHSILYHNVLNIKLSQSLKTGEVNFVDAIQSQFQRSYWCGSRQKLSNSSTMHQSESTPLLTEFSSSQDSGYFEREPDSLTPGIKIQNLRKVGGCRSWSLSLSYKKRKKMQHWQQSLKTLPQCGGRNVLKDPQKLRAFGNDMSCPIVTGVWKRHQEEHRRGGNESEHIWRADHCPAGAQRGRQDHHYVHAYWYVALCYWQVALCYWYVALCYSGLCEKNNSTWGVIIVIIMTLGFASSQEGTTVNT